MNPNENDDRFSARFSDPKFKKFSKRNLKIKVDSRFQKMNENKDFQKTAKYDKYGRKIKTKTFEPNNYFEIETEETQRKGNKANKKMKFIELENQLENHKSNSKSKSKNKFKSVSIESSENDEDEKDNNFYYDKNHLDGEETKRIAIVNIDWNFIHAVDLLSLFRSFLPTTGAVLSVKIYPSQYGLKMMEKDEIYGPPRDIIQEKEKSNINKDDKNINKDDKNIIDDKNINDDENNIIDDDENIIDDDNIFGTEYSLSNFQESNDESFDQEKLRKYEKQKMRYYFAVAEFDSKETALSVYNNCEGMEYIQSSNLLNLSFVPDEMEFEQKPKEVATDVPSGYHPINFYTKALQHSKVELTWDQPDARRQIILNSKLEDQEINEDIYQEFIASDSESESESESESQPKMEPNEAANSNSEKTETNDEKINDEKKNNIQNEEEVKKLKPKYRNRFKELLEHIHQKEKEQEDIEITFIPGLSEKAQEILESKKEKEESQNKSSWEKYKDKLKEKNKLKKKSKQDKNRSKDEDENSQDENDDQSLFSDDIEIDEDDPFFISELGNSFRSKKKTNKKKNNKKKQMDQETKNEEMKKENQEKAELELLMLNDKVKFGDNLSKQKSQENEKLILNQKNKKKRKKEIKEDQNFQFNPQDERFNRLYDSHLYNLDPTNPLYQSSQATNEIRKEQLKRHEHLHEDFENVDQIKKTKLSLNSNQKSNRNSNQKKEFKNRNSQIDSLVSRIKRNISQKSFKKK